MVRAERGRPIEILFVGDDPATVRATRSALRDDGIANAMTIVPSVAEALDHLNRRGAPTDCGRPDVVLLDLDSTGEAGGGLHEAAAAAGDGGPVPVVGLWSVDRPDVVADGTGLHCLEKPLDGVEFIDVLVGTADIWVRIVNGPPRERLTE